jgi:broad specificity phosphatase PhoE
MLYEIKVPEAGFSITEGTVVQWHKNVGERIQEGETIVSVETDKVVVEIEKAQKEKILRDHPGQEVLIIGHMIVNRFLIGMLLEYPLEEIQRMEQNNGCVYLVERNGEARVSHFIDGEIREGFFYAPLKEPSEPSRRS